MSDRLPLAFACGDSRLAATLDTAAGRSGLLIVTGGNEVRAGAFAGQAALAARVAASGHPVFRFDRRGVGDSEGENTGFTGSGADIAAALRAFRAAAPQLERVTGFGNCDAASALMLNAGVGCDGLVLANPWTFEDADAETMPAAQIRARYAAKLRNPRELARLLAGRVSFGKLAGSLIRAARRAPAPAQGSLAQRMAEGLARFDGPVRLLIADADRTGLAFLDSWAAADTRLARCPGASHAFAEPAARDWLAEHILAAVR